MGRYGEIWGDIGGGLHAREPRLVPLCAAGRRDRAALRRRGRTLGLLALQRLQLRACLLDGLVGRDAPG